MSRTTHIKYGALEAPGQCIHTNSFFSSPFFFIIILLFIILYFWVVRRETGERERVVCAFWAQPMRRPNAIDVPGFERQMDGFANYCAENGLRLD